MHLDGEIGTTSFHMKTNEYFESGISPIASLFPFTIHRSSSTNSHTDVKPTSQLQLEGRKTHILNSSTVSQTKQHTFCAPPPPPPPLHLLIVIKFVLIFWFSHLSSPSVWWNSSRSHSLPRHPSLSLGSSQPLTSDPQAGSPVGQKPSLGVGGLLEWEKGWEVGFWGLPASCFDRGYRAFTTAAIATGRDGRESSLDGALASVIRLWSYTHTHAQAKWRTHNLICACSTQSNFLFELAECARKDFLKLQDWWESCLGCN